MATVETAAVLNHAVERVSNRRLLLVDGGDAAGGCGTAERRQVQDDRKVDVPLDFAQSHAVLREPLQVQSQNGRRREDQQLFAGYCVNGGRFRQTSVGVVFSFAAFIGVVVGRLRRRRRRGSPALGAIIAAVFIGAG